MLATNANSSHKKGQLEHHIKSVHDKTSHHKKINLNTILNLFHEKNEICLRPMRIQVIKKDNLNTILNLFKKKTKYACDQCEFKSSQKDQLEHHIKSVHEKTKYACTQCEFKS